MEEELYLMLPFFRFGRLLLGFERYPGPSCFGFYRLLPFSFGHTWLGVGTIYYLLCMVLYIVVIGGFEWDSDINTLAEVS